MANIKIPARFEKKLNENQYLEGIVKSTLSAFGDILRDNKLYFFEEYTDHGISHIENVMASSDNLIVDKTFDEVLNSKDIGFYLLSVILHDIGMHLNLDGFNVLLGGQFDSVIVNEIDKVTWKDSWNDFLSEAKKYSGKQLKSVFGDENIVIRDPPLSQPGNINNNDKILIGEFLRKNHARLAHEIALNGFPGRGFIKFADNLDLKEKYLIGLIARSHGVDLRKCVDNIEHYYGKNAKRYPLSVHAAYLMVILRTADYLQIDRNRTSETLLKLKTFASPISELEHGAHLSVDSIDDKYQEDPERIYVYASPKDSRMYLKLKKLLSDVQYEFDISWAVLGELYGKAAEKLEFKYRRITSNLNEESFIERQNYVADSFAFKANDEIVKLLISPLYGNDPKYGVRELLQNAVDACNERDLVEKDRLNNSYEPIVKIAIVKEIDDFFFCIIDNGIGMNVDTIKNYFLSAGSSFRKSADWQKDFVDEFGKVKVRRSGRFGVGVLAAFLIGKEITVETKNYKSLGGFIFTANINTDQINITKKDDLPIGTTIKIKLDKNILTALGPDGTKDKYGNHNSGVIWHQWYTLSRPKIECSYLEEKIESYKNFNPDLLDELPIQWNAIDFQGYNKILWTNSRNFCAWKFICNGIVIPFANVSDIGLINDSNLRISVFDNNGFLPLSLSRDQLTNELPFLEELRRDLYKDFIAYLLTSKVNQNITNKYTYFNQKLGYPDPFTYRNTDYFHYGNQCYNMEERTNYSVSNLLNTILIGKTGFILNYNYFIKELETVKILFVQFSSSDFNGNIELDLKDRFMELTNANINSIYDYAAALEPSYFNYITREFDDPCATVFMKNSKYNFLFQADKKRLSVWLKNLCKVKFVKKQWVCLTMGNPNESIITDGFLNKYPNLNFIREHEVKSLYRGDFILDELLEKYIGKEVIIPFELEKRAEKYPLAFKELDRYMQKYRKLWDQER
ncbi:ATP-binding protein [Mucilaginibacter sp.]|uniref:HD domain-containing protein n=1 Tax=Mucilaginibacter sp. TaxID=1882438 RepID=UPI0025E507F0|nr:ATP-binding protein [Mucilaginibacter sp.]